MILLPNVYFDVLRSSYTTSGGTDVAGPYLKHVEGHITRIKDSPLVPFAASVFRAEYEVYTEIGIDITRGDQITNIIRKDNGKQYSFGAHGSSETLFVLDSSDSSPGPLEYRDTVLGRFVGGGPA